MYLERILQDLTKKQGDQKLFIPGLWLMNKFIKPVIVDYPSFLAYRIQEIINNRNKKIIKTENDWTGKAVIYNLFVRFFTAYDHDQDGTIGSDKDDITLNSKGIRETGTFLKTIALLPYLKKLGINTIHLLPITEIGIEGRKGDLGSPYAIKNPFKIDPMLADPFVQIPVEGQYKAVIEAAHILGFKVVQEFIFRTTAIDSDWSCEHPSWFYWLKENSSYGPPKFTVEELEQILKVPKGKGTYIPPRKSYRALFDIPPDQMDNKRHKIASAFADWPPDDLQPPWSDVTYLRLYNYDYRKENNYNYIAYNTIRYYDPELAKKEHINHELWNKIAGIIPYYQKTFGIDGAMIDMGHALPNQLKSNIISNAREIDPSFAFWDENFDNKEETKRDGYNAVIGDVWYKITKRNGFKNLIRMGLESKPLTFFGAAETHNSPRLTNIKKKKASWILFNILPNVIPFLHNGYELNERLPVNTGLNFDKMQIENLRHEKLALFYKTSLCWESYNIIAYIKKTAELVAEYPWIFNGKNLELLETSNSKVIGYYKKNKHNEAIILFNTNFYTNEVFGFSKSSNFGKYEDLLTQENFDTNQELNMKSGQVILGVKSV